MSRVDGCTAVKRRRVILVKMALNYFRCREWIVLVVNALITCFNLSLLLLEVLLYFSHLVEIMRS